MIGQLKAFKIPITYTTQLFFPISEAKKKDLISPCSKGIILQELYSWYESLPSNKNVVDRLLEPDVTEEVED